MYRQVVIPRVKKYSKFFSSNNNIYLIRFNRIGIQFLTINYELIFYAVSNTLIYVVD